MKSYFVVCTSFAVVFHVKPPSVLNPKAAKTKNIKKLDISNLFYAISGTKKNAQLLEKF